MKKVVFQNGPTEGPVNIKNAIKPYVFSIIKSSQRRMLQSKVFFYYSKWHELYYTKTHYIHIDIICKRNTLQNLS